MRRLCPSLSISLVSLMNNLYNMWKAERRGWFGNSSSSYIQLIKLNSSDSPHKALHQSGSLSSCLGCKDYARNKRILVPGSNYTFCLPVQRGVKRVSDEVPVKQDHCKVCREDHSCSRSRYTTTVYCLCHSLVLQLSYSSNAELRTVNSINFSTCRKHDQLQFKPSCAK